jgi:hypothetical protein
MSLQDLFKKQNKNSSVATAENATSSAEYVESVATIRAKEDLNNQFVPRLNYATGSNFAKFGSVELYYDYGFRRIYNEYPYDGTEQEKLEFRLSSSYLDDYIFENLYPRRNGNIKFSFVNKTTTAINEGYGKPATPEYILTLGGPHTASGGMVNKTLASTFEKSNIYNTSLDLGSSLELDLDPGVTVEFWLKKDGFSASDTTKEVIFDLWNNQNSSSLDYGRLTIALTTSAGGTNPFLLTVQSGTNGFSEYQPTTTGITTSTVADGNWHHYAFTFASQSAGIQTKIYIDGANRVTDTNGSAGINNIQTVSGNVSLLGGLITAPSGTLLSHDAYITGSGKLSGSMDEFRYWKRLRTAKQISNTFFIPIGGGTNEFDYNRSLGLYYKFNEGITGAPTIDNQVLDYSGRISNGVWNNYTAGARSTTSAMVESGYALAEFKDPIIYSSHPDVISTLATLTATGSEQDNAGTSKFMGLLPGWLQEKDKDIYNNQIKKFTQILASYFDNLNAQIGEFNNIFDESYPTTTQEPYPFAQKLLESRGFVAPDLFTDGDLINYLLQKDDNETFEQNISDVKNRIYHNIYNNLTFILKSKGTEKSFRNLLRCYGIDTEVMRLSLYADDSTYTILDNYENTSVEKKALNFNNRNNLEATVYNTASAGSTLTYIQAPEDDPAAGPTRAENSGFTIECEAIFPYQMKKSDEGYFPKQFNTASVFGFHRANPLTPADYTWYLPENITVHAVKPDDESKDAYFVATGTLAGGGIRVVSPTFFNVYENNKWNFAIRIRNEKYPYTYGLTGSTLAGFDVEFVGFNSDGYTTKNSFSVSSSITYNEGQGLLNYSKRLYAGAYKTNFTGSTIFKSDVLITDVKYWQSYLDDETIQYHSYNPDNIGTKTPFMSDNVNNKTPYVQITDYETLAMHWRFDTLTGSDSSGELTGFDFSSGSTENASRNAWIGEVCGHKYPFKGQNFAPSSTKAIDKRFIYSAKQRNFGVLMSSDGVTIKNDANTMLFTDDDVSDNFYSFEKSYHGVISQEMLNIFASLVEFNDLIGSPIDGYKKSYKEMEKLTRLFFEKVESRIEPERFFEFYKWIDSSIMFALGQLFPASAKFSETSRNVIESHLLERNKLDRKFPILIDVSATEGYAHSINELFYSWKFGHAPVNGNENENCLWQKHRKERTNITDRQTLLDNLNSGNNSKYLAEFKQDGTAYAGSTYALRNFSSLHKFSVAMDKSIHGGTNYSQNKNREIVWDATYIHGPVSTGALVGIPQNVLVVGLGEGQGTEAFIDCVDVENPNEKRKYRLTTVTGRRSALAQGAATARNNDEDYKAIVKGEIAWPHNLISGSVTTGYQAEVVSKFKPGVILSNIHSDTYAPGNEIGMQGPFTETWVGGHQSRHVDLNKLSGLPPASAATSATATLTFDYNPNDGDTITIGDGVTTPITYAFKDTISDAATQIQRGISASATMQATRTKIIADFNISIPGGISTTRILTNLNLGTIGNYTLATSNPARISISGFSGAVDEVLATPNNLDAWDTRPEGWRLLLNECSDADPSYKQGGSNDGAMGFVGPDYGGPYPDYNRKYAIRYREERAKRPINIRNIQTTTASAKVGNFSHNYEVVMVAGKEGNNFAARGFDPHNRTSDQVLPDSIWNQLPNSTNYQTLVSFLPGHYGNVWGCNEAQDPYYEDVKNSVPSQVFLENQRQVDNGAGEVADGSFFVSGSIANGARPSGSFLVYGTENYMFDQLGGGSVPISNGAYVKMQSGARHMVLDTTHPVNPDTDTNKSVSTGSGGTSYYDYFQTKLTSSTFYTTASYETYAPRSEALVFSGDNNFSSNYYYSDYGAAFDNASENYFFWVDLGRGAYPAGTAFRKKQIYLHLSSSGDRAKELFLSGGDLHFNKYYYTDASNFATASYKVSNFESTYENSNYIQIWVKNTYTTGNPLTDSATRTRTAIYVNTVSQSCVTDHIVTGEISNGIASKMDSDGMYLVGGNNLDTHASFAGKIASFGFLSEEASDAKRLRAYNNGYLQGLDLNNDIDSADILESYLVLAEDGLAIGTTITNGSILSGSFNVRNMTASIALPDIAQKIQVGGGASDGCFEPPYAKFDVTGTLPGVVYNYSFDFFNNAPFTYFATGSTYLSSSGATSSIAGAGGGTNNSGSQDGDQFTISNGFATTTFEISTDNTGSSPSNILLNPTGSNLQFWSALSSSIVEHTEFDIITISSASNSYGQEFARFMLTSSLQGIASNGTFSAILGGASEAGGARNSFFNLLSPIGGVEPITYYNIIERIRDDLTSSNSVITSRFSAPGGPEIQSQGFLDTKNQELSAYNALPFRNLTVRSSASGEPARIRVNDIHGQRYGLQTHLQRYSGQFGYDSSIAANSAGAISVESYVTFPSFHKIQRNTAKRYVSGASGPVTDTIYNNGFYQSCIPQSDFQYSWITASVGDDLTQRILGFAPASGYVSASSGYVDAIVFPSASQILGSL